MCKLGLWGEKWQKLFLVKEVCPLFAFLQRQHASDLRSPPSRTESRSTGSQRCYCDTVAPSPSLLPENNQPPSFPDLSGLSLCTVFTGTLLLYLRFSVCLSDISDWRIKRNTGVLNQMVSLLEEREFMQVTDQREVNSNTAWFFQAA